MKKVTTSNTKAQIFEAYEQVLQELRNKANEDPKQQQQIQKETKILEKVVVKSETGIVENIDKFQNHFIESLSLLKQNLLEENEGLNDIREAIKIERENLKQLYDISAKAESLTAIILAQKNTETEFEEKMTTYKENTKLSLDKQRQEWQHEKKQYEDKVKQEATDLKTKRTREEEEYIYDLNQARKKDTDDYETRRIKQELDLKEYKRKVEKDFSDRENIIKGREDEFEILKKESESFKNEKEKAIQTAKLEEAARLKLEFKYTQDLTNKETEGQLKLKDLEISILKSKIEEMDSQLRLINTKADISEKTVKDIALKAIESSKQVHVIEKEKNEKE